MSDEHLKRWREIKDSKFEYLGDGFYVHKKNMPVEMWDDAEFEEYERLLSYQTACNSYIDSD